MSDTRKDIAKQAIYKTRLEVSANEDGTFEIIFNGDLVASNLPERWLDHELCSKRGFCGEELRAIKQELMERRRCLRIL